MNEKVTELDGVLVEVDAVSAIEERGLGSVLRNSVPTCYFLRFNLNEMSTENLVRLTCWWCRGEGEGEGEGD